jgi:hypothetical protein
MRCLHCGSTLSAFKKLTDSDFCSTEHRDQFYTEQQRLIVERLKHSAARFHRLRRGGIEELARVAAAVAAQVVEAQPPAKIAAFLSAIPDGQDRSLCLQFLPQLDPDLVATNPPGRRIRSIARHYLSSLIPDLPWPRYNPGLLSCDSYELAEASSDIAYGSIFELTARVAIGFSPASLMLSRRPDVLSRPARKLSVPRMAKPKPTISLAPVRLPIGPGRYALAEFGYRNFVDLAPVKQSLPERFLDASPIEIATGLEIPASLRFRSEQKMRGIGFLDRVYKVRPRSGILPTDLPAIRPVAVEPIAAALSALRPRRLSTSTRSEPARVNRFIRSRPRGPADSIAPVRQFGPAAEIGDLRPGIPALRAHQTEFSPAVSGRPLRITIRAAEGGSTEEITGAAALDFTSHHVKPGFSTAADCAPLAVDRFIRTRPRGPADSIGAVRPIVPAAEIGDLRPGIPALRAHQTEFSPAPSGRPLGITVLAAAGGNTEEITGAAALDFTPHHVNPGFSAAADCAPLSVDRFYRPRPRGPVFDDALPASHGLEVIPNGFVSKPAVRQLDRPALAFEPGRLDRLFRMRPRAGVVGESVADLIPSTTPEPLLSSPATPRLVGLTDTAPSPATRMFRMRPGSAAGIESAQPAVVIGAYPAQGKSDPAIIGFVSSKAGELAPPLLDRLYRGRPKLGVPSSPVVELTSPWAMPEPFESKPAIVSIGLGECSPNPVIRMYRFRPKSAVDTGVSLAAAGCVPLDFSPGRPQFAPDWWDVLSGPKPLFVNRMYRMRLKQPAEDVETLTKTIRTKHVPVSDPEPVLATMPAASADAAPSFLNRLYRMRPKSGKAPAPATNPIPCEAVEPRPHSGAPSAVLQAFSKHWKATPMSIKAMAATISLLLMIAFLPLGIPSMASDDSPIRQAIVGRAAIEHSDDFGAGLSNWQGIDKWKRKPSGVMEPVGLGLFKPSLPLRDYRMTFSGQIVKQALGFVVRARDDRNYQAIKLVTVKPGPLPTVAVVRYAVVDGKETNRQKTILPMTVAADTVYRISLDVNGQSFTLMVQGKVVDFWSEEQLKTGGAGFFSAKGEQALIQNIRISHHDDTIGRLFAALVLQTVQASNGSETRR